MVGLKMNDLYKSLNYQATDICIEQGSNASWKWEKEYARVIIRECLSQMTDHLDKQRIIKHFGLVDT
jgi:hypothetical protein